MLLKKDCVLAINEWETARKNYQMVRSLINPKSVFRFDHDALSWFTQNSANAYFHAYFGVFNNEFLMIVVPLNQLGKEVDLLSYLAVPLSPLTENVILREVEVIKKVRETTISTNLLISSVREETQSPLISEPLIGISDSVERIRSWSNQCLDWFYYECSTFEGARVFKTFNVNSADLVNGNPNVSEIYCFFGFRESFIQNMQVPDLIFVAVNGSSQQENYSAPTSDPVSIMADFSSPCPPFCGNASGFIIFK